MSCYSVGDEAIDTLTDLMPSQFASLFHSLPNKALVPNPLPGAAHRQNVSRTYVKHGVTDRKCALRRPDAG